MNFFVIFLLSVTLFLTINLTTCQGNGFLNSAGYSHHGDFCSLCENTFEFGRGDSRVCASNGDYFASRCWFYLYRLIFNRKDLSLAHGNWNCRRSKPCVCNVDCANIDNPICTWDSGTETQVTFQNHCKMNCANACQARYQVIHCGPCNFTGLYPGECGGQGWVDCIPHVNKPFPLCQTSSSSCCANGICPDVFLPFCGINRRNGDMMTFPNECFFTRCQDGCDPDEEWEALSSGNGNGACPCTTLPIL